jgi:hypothetical protein
VRRPARPAVQLVDIVLITMLAEFIWLWSRRGFEPRAAAAPLIALGPGVCLALAVRAAARGARAGGALALLAALPFHVADLARRPIP